MSSNCFQCGALLPAGAHECPFCHAPTAFAHAMHARALEEARANEARAQFQRQQAMASERGQLDAFAQASLFWSLGSLVLCCVPGPQVMAIVRYVSARKAAQRLAVDVPGKATAGLALSIVSIVLGVSSLTWALIRNQGLQQQAEARVAELDKQLAARAPAGVVLDAQTACALAERHVLTDGHEGSKGFYFVRFECNGKLTVEGDAAELDDLAFHQDSSGQKYRVNTCFLRGTKWYVSGTSKSACPLIASAPVAPTTRATSRPAPTPSASPRR